MIFLRGGWGGGGGAGGPREVVEKEAMGKM